VWDNTSVLTKHENGDFAHIFHGKRVPCVIGERPAGLVACLAMTREVIAAQRRPRNSTMRRIKLHEGSTEPIISEISKMDVP
jgi:hypothetical protein